MHVQIVDNDISSGTANIVFVGETNKPRVSVTLKHKEDPVNQKRIQCWQVEDATKLIGNMDNYKIM